MGFLQIISFHTDRIEEFKALESAWQSATVGQRTVTGGQLFADRDDPTHFVGIDWFTDYDSAMVNSGLAATDEFAAKAMTLATGEPTFSNLEPAHPASMQCEPELRRSLETGSMEREAFADDVVADMIVPGTRVVVRGVDVLEAGLAEEGPGREMEVWDAQPTPTGFVVEYAYHTTGPTPILSVGACVVTVQHGRITRLLVTCGGNWDVETETEIRERTGDFGPAAG